MTSFYFFEAFSLFFLYLSSSIVVLLLCLLLIFLLPLTVSVVWTVLLLTLMILSSGRVMHRLYSLVQGLSLLLELQGLLGLVVELLLIRLVLGAILVHLSFLGVI